MRDERANRTRAARLLVHIDRCASMFMDPGGYAVISVAAEFILDSQRFVGRNRADRQCRVVLYGRQKHLARARHRDEFDREEILASGLDDQRRARRIACLRYHRITLLQKPL